MMYAAPDDANSVHSSHCMNPFATEAGSKPRYLVKLSILSIDITNVRV